MTGEASPFLARVVATEYAFAHAAGAALASVPQGVETTSAEAMGMKGFVLTLVLFMTSLAAHAETIDFDRKLKELGIELPVASAPAANYVKAVRVGTLLFLSGHAAVSGFRGKLGKDMTTDEGYQAARSTAISAIATLKQELGDLNKVKRVVKVMGMVNSTPDYTEQHLVVNGFSDLMVAVFGDKGKHARSAVGMGSLPFDFAVEVDLIVELE